MFGLASFPKAILHVDGDAFFASCEQSRHPELKGKPVVTGKERGIASSLSYEAKARGVTRGMPLFEIRRICPDVVILPSDYETYSLLSRRLYAIVRRYTHAVEECGIDECFADLSGYGNSHSSGYTKLAEQIKHDLDTELGFTFSVGLAPSKVLAKAGSKWKKPSGLTVITARDRWRYLDKLPVDKVWGIGPATSAYLTRRNIFTAGDFARANEWWVKNNLTRPFWEIWQELNGASVMPLHLEEKSSYFSIQKFKTFTPPSKDPDYVFSQLSKNIENACIKARRYNLVCKKLFFYLKTQDYRYYGLELKLSEATNIATDLLKELVKCYPMVFDKQKEYRATGIILMELEVNKNLQMDLFSDPIKTEKMTKLFGSVDEIANKYGKHSLYLGSSYQAINNSQHEGSRKTQAERKNELFKGETFRKRINIPMLGSVI